MHSRHASHHESAIRVVVICKQRDGTLCCETPGKTENSDGRRRALFISIHFPPGVSTLFEFATISHDINGGDHSLTFLSHECAGPNFDCESSV